MKKIVEIDQITAGYRDDVVFHKVSLDIFENDFIGIIGPNGGGKTTLLKVILGLIKPTEGSIRFNIEKGNVGYLPQMNNIDRKFPLSVMNVITSGLMSQDKYMLNFSRESKNKGLNILKMMGLEGLENKAFGELSGGQVQRVLLGRAIISDPKLLILDEPDTFVDSQFESDLYKILRELNQRMAIVIVSHDIGTIAVHIKTIVCVNHNLHYHPSNVITKEQLENYNCPIQLITHGDVPHTVLAPHKH